MLFLASESPRRRELLRAAGMEFSVCVPAGVEELRVSPSPRDLPMVNAERKAAAAAALHPDAWVLGADTVIVHENRVIGKPRDLDDAAAILRRLSGTEHEVITGMALLRCDRGFRDVWSETTRVRFRMLDDAVIARYLQLVPVLDKAGAYAVQEHGEMLIDAVDGELENVIGLPLATLRKKLAALAL